MNRVAFTVFGFDVMWYGVLIALGIIVAITTAKFTSKIRGISYDKLLDVVLISLPIGVIGARIYYVLFNLNEYMKSPIQMFNIRGGGLAIHGGIIFGLTTAFIFTYRKRLSFLQFADAAAPCIIIAQAIGRWGNFFNSEAHGGPVSYNFISMFPSFIVKGMYIGGIYYHPTFLYESAWNLIGFFILLYLLSKKPKNGTVLAGYLIVYSIGRFFIEGLRTDSLMFFNLKMAQLVSLAGIVFGIVLLVFIYKRNMA